jgi:hypothetical protein
MQHFRPALRAAAAPAEKLALWLVACAALAAALILLVHALTDMEAALVLAARV